MRRTAPANPRFVALALAMGGVVIGIVMPVLLAYLGITVMEIAPGIDLVWLLFPAIAVVDWIMAYWFWRKGSPAVSRDGPVVG